MCGFLVFIVLLYTLLELPQRLSIVVIAFFLEVFQLKQIGYWPFFANWKFQMFTNRSV